MQGYRVLFIDIDPQASSTSMFGYRPELLDADRETLLPVFSDEPVAFSALVKPTHWDGLDLIPSCLDLYGAEYALAIPDSSGGGARQKLEKLRVKLPEIASRYDVVVCDPPPALGMISLSVIRAVNALVVPTPPSSLDYASTVSYLEMLGEALQSLDNLGLRSDFKFVQILATKVAENKAAHVGLRDAMIEIFQDRILPTTLLDSSEFDNALINGRTVFEYTGKSTKTYKRCRNNLDRVLREIENAIRSTWSGDPVVHN
jgi:chromosome partitioning protein